MELVTPTAFTRAPDEATAPLGAGPTETVSPRTTGGGVIFTDDNLRIRWLSPALRAALVPAESLHDLTGRAGGSSVVPAALAVLDGAEPPSAVPVGLLKVDGTSWIGEVTLEAVDNASAPGALMVTLRPGSAGSPSPEVTDRDGHDELTALPNRRLLLERLSALLARGPNGVAAALLIDLDRLKVVNDSMGHEAGDRLLTVVAQRLGHAAAELGMVARIGGDEFVVLLDGLEAEYEATQVADRILQAMRTPVLIEDRRHVVTASIGIVFIEGETDPADVLRDADTAMYEAKAQGRDRFSVFDDLLRVRAIRRFDIEEDLRRAIAAGELRVHYQPQVSLATGRIVAAEALVRWEHPEQGLIFPGAFIGIAEETGLVADIGAVVLAEACEAAGGFQRKSRNGVPIGVSVNVSPSQLKDLDLSELVGATLTANGLPASSLTLELTENALVADDPNIVLNLARLRDLGVRIAIDDFGTGYSSLAYLSRIPAQELKIDRSFIEEMTNEPGRAVVAGICALARGVGLTVVAEGVETEAQAGWLSEMGCETIQGFLVAKGMPTKDFSRMLVRDRGRAFRRPPGTDGF